MTLENIVERILSDGRAEADEVISAANAEAKKTLDFAKEESIKERSLTEKDVEEKCQLISERKAATARLDAKKIDLAAKRKVIDSIYEKALSRLNALNKEDALSLINHLLETYAEEGDMVVFAKNFVYKTDAEKLPVIKAKKLVISDKRADIDGGINLIGKKSDKDLSFGALLSVDREQYQSEIALELFKVR